MTVDFARLLRFARELQRALSFPQLLELVVAEVEATTSYRYVWLALFEPELDRARILAAAGETGPPIWEKAQLIPIGDDQMMLEIMAGSGAVVVEDARTDPRTNKHLVEALGNRTIINMPLVLLDAPLGALGIGTFGDEGCRPPTPDQIEVLQAMASQLSVAVGRLRWMEERAVAARKQAELERRLHQAQKLESLGLLAGGVAHDFNNLIMVVLHTARVVGAGPLEPQQREDLQDLTRAAERAAGLTQQLLAMGRQQPQRLEPMDLNVRLRELIQLLGRLMPSNVAIDLIQGASLPTVLGDASQLDQVLMNLCLNARDAMPDGGRLTLETEQVRLNGEYVAAHPWAKGGRYVLISVTDTGHGMPPEVLERVFEPFFTTKPGSKGTGLGLAVAYGVVQQHGGMLHAYSEVGVGTTFKVYLPVFERDASRVGSKIEAPVPHGEGHILVADDDESVRSVVRRILQRAGYQVTLVADGVGAVDAVTSGVSFDVVILDAMMPRMNGREAFERITALKTGVPVLFSTGYAGDVLPAAVVEDCGAELLSKPYDPDELLRAVRRALGKRKR